MKEQLHYMTNDNTVEDKREIWNVQASFTVQMVQPMTASIAAHSEEEAVELATKLFKDQENVQIVHAYKMDEVQTFVDNVRPEELAAVYDATDKLKEEDGDEETPESEESTVH